MGIFLFWIACAVLGGFIGGNKNRGVAGFFLGLFLGPLGILIILVMKPSKEDKDQIALDEGQKKCPFCAEFIKNEAVVCRFCGKDQPKEDTREDLITLLMKKDSNEP